ncbi:MULTISPECIES: hypothetical protein [Thermomonospora]|uniref:Uncharacterized protein n=1 Tax=Thermomonospora curvata (strain ATCC 19995 / DSM 43183 / JCM 3096 / KCTC 9072 / NBRC 15933 / NCIMB 10081 / Henssen B9) TaxID=471852 RepID=D1A2L1_THECD|nr:MULTISPECIES: hypothetical protein [Thermomonospora]ACY96031.1 hypothetical protein Tcur_0433 [Thermomonospora curvata DSM 43183]
MLHEPFVPRPWGEPSSETAGPSLARILLPLSDQDLATGARILNGADPGPPEPPARRAEHRP